MIPAMQMLQNKKAIRPLIRTNGFVLPPNFTQKMRLSRHRIPDGVSYYTGGDPSNPTWKHSVQFAAPRLRSPILSRNLTPAGFSLRRPNRVLLLFTAFAYSVSIILARCFFFVKTFPKIFYRFTGEKGFFQRDGFASESSEEIRLNKAATI